LCRWLERCQPSSVQWSSASLAKFFVGHVVELVVEHFLGHFLGHVTSKGGTDGTRSAGSIRRYSACLMMNRREGPNSSCGTEKIGRRFSSAP
jgi:hypothetical protein